MTNHSNAETQHVSALSVGASGIFNRSPHPATLRRDTRSNSQLFQDNPLHMAAWDFSPDGNENDLRDPLLDTPKPTPEARQSSVRMAAIYGVINTIITVPSQIGFALIIYRDPFFTDTGHKNYMPMLLKLVLLSSAIHQLVFVCLSSLPFAVAQVQDAGLIFLSSMASTVVATMLTGEKDPDDIVATVVVSLSMSTAVLGVLLVITGKLRLAGFIQYLPLPVVGGYLAFIGLYCGQAGVQLMAGVNGVEGLGNWKDFFLDGGNLILLCPGLASAVLLVLVTKYVKHNLALPLCLVMLPTSFFIVLAATGTSLQEARDYGWVSQPSDSQEPFYMMYSLFDFTKVQWSAAFPQILPTFFAMYCVVAFGSCLDVAAIQYDSGRGLDFDHELKTVGWSNVVSGALGGYTGSYIFSQTLFSLRNGVSSRVNGLFVVITELFLVVMPFEIVSFVPKFYFGSVMLFISFDLLFDWLAHSYHKLDVREYMLVWGTFIIISYSSLEVGMATGVVFAALNFVYSYSQTSSVEVIGARSSMVRGFEDRKILAAARDAIVTVRLHGYQFFGTTIQVTEAIQSRITVEVEVDDNDDDSDDADNNQSENQAGRSSFANDLLREDDSVYDLSMPIQEDTAQDLNVNRLTRATTSDTNASRGSSATNGSSAVGGKKLKKILKRLVSSDSSDKPLRKRVTVKNFLGVSLTPNLKMLSANYKSGNTPASFGMFGRWRKKQPKATQAVSSSENLVRTKFVVLDCTNVAAIDATSARSCFLTLRQILESHDIQMIFANLTIASRKLLTAHGVLVHDSVLDPPKDVQVHGARRSRTSHDFSMNVNEAGSEAACSEYGGVAFVPKDKSPLAFDSLDDALEWCEDQVLINAKENTDSDAMDAASYRLSASAHSTSTDTVPVSMLEAFLYGSDAKQAIPEEFAVKASHYFERIDTLSNNSVLFDVGDPSDYLYLVESGHVKLYALNPHVDGFQWSGVERKHQISYAGGGLVGELDFFLNRPRTLCAVVYAPPDIVLHRLSRGAYELMKQEWPEFSVMFQESLLNCFALSSSTIVRMGD